MMAISTSSLFRQMAYLFPWRGFPASQLHRLHMLATFKEHPVTPTVWSFQRRRALKFRTLHFIHFEATVPGCRKELVRCDKYENVNLSKHFCTDISDLVNQKEPKSDMQAELLKVRIEALGIEMGHFRDVVTVFQDYGAMVETVNEFLLAHPAILSRTVEQIDTAIKFLIDYGFQIDSVFIILPVVKNIFRQKRSQIVQVLDFLRSYGIQDGDILNIVTAMPDILNVTNLKQLNQAYQKLGTIFQTKDINRIITRTPEILFEEWENVERKFDYIIKTINCDYKQIMRSSVMGKSYDHIRSRHLFLKRGGLFETPDKHGKTKHMVNPYLSQIVDTTDEHFATRVCSMDVKDYLVFREVLNLEDELVESSDQENESDF